MFPIPFTLLMVFHKEVEAQFATPRPNRTDSQLAEAATPKSRRVLLDRLFLRFRQARYSKSEEDARLDGCGQTASCGEWQ